MIANNTGYADGHAGAGATASSVREDQYKPINAFDNNLGTRWSSEFSDPQWLMADFGEVREFVDLTLHWETAYGKAYDILISEDGINWKKVYTENNGTGMSEDIYFKKSAGRYLKIHGRERDTAWGYSLWEVSLKEPAEELSVTASSSSPGNLPGNILDGSRETIWHSGR